jgi:transposase
MARQSKRSRKPRRRFAEEFKSEALALADKVGVSEAAEQLKVQPSQLDAWRSKAQLLQRQGQVERKLATANVRLKRLRSC